MPSLTFLWKMLQKRSENTSDNASENAVWGAVGAPQRGEAGRETVRTWKRHCAMWEDLGQSGWRAAGTTFEYIILLIISNAVLAARRPNCPKSCHIPQCLFHVRTVSLLASPRCGAPAAPHTAFSETFSEAFSERFQSIFRRKVREGTFLASPPRS